MQAKVHPSKTPQTTHCLRNPALPVSTALARFYQSSSADHDGAAAARSRFNHTRQALFIRVRI